MLGSVEGNPLKLFQRFWWQVAAMVREPWCYRYAPFACIGLSLLLVILLGALGCRLEWIRAGDNVLSATVGRIRSHAERTAGQVESQLAETGGNNDLALIRKAGWLRSHWQRAVVAQHERIYAAVVDSHGVVVAHSDPTREGKKVSDAWILRPFVEGGPGAVETADKVLADHIHCLDLGAPININGKRVGMYHSGVRMDWINEQLAAAQRVVIARWIWMTIGIASIVLLAAASLVVIMQRSFALQRDLNSAELRRVTEINRLITGLAHEIRNPLNAVRINLCTAGRVSSILDGASTGKLQEILRQSTGEVARIEALIGELLGYIRAEPEADEVIDVYHEVADAVAFFQPAAAEDGITVTCATTDKRLFARVSRRRLRQMILNLLTNAQESLAEGGRIDVSLRAASGCVQITVADNGPGVPAAALEQIFAPFYSTKQTGVGLGLTLVRTYAEQCGGHICCRNRDGGGAEFCISIPLVSLDVELEAVA
jgi:two-component system sensor histidine kinase HydH